MPRAASVAARSAAAARTAPARGRGAPARRPARGRAAPPRTAIRVVPRGGRPAAAAIGAGVLDRMLRGRVWIACIASLLAGVVFLNVSLLEMNRGITQDAQRAVELKRDNSQLRLRVAELASSERIQEAAAARGFVLPAPGDVHYLESRRGDGRRAAAGITTPTQIPAPAPQPQVAAPQGTAHAESAPPAAMTPAPQTEAPAAQTETAPPAGETPAAETAPLAGGQAAPAGGAQAPSAETP